MIELTNWIKIRIYLLLLSYFAILSAVRRWGRVTEAVAGSSPGGAVLRGGTR